MFENLKFKIGMLKLKIKMTRWLWTKKIITCKIDTKTNEIAFTMPLPLGEQKVIIEGE